MGEVSYLKVKLADMEEKQSHGVDRQHKAEVRAFYPAVPVKLLRFNIKELPFMSHRQLFKVAHF